MGDPKLTIPKEYIKARQDYDIQNTPEPYSILPSDYGLVSKQMSYAGIKDPLSDTIGNLNDLAVQNQSFFGNAIKGLGRVLNTAVFEIAKTPGYLAGIVTGFDNQYLEGLNQAKEYVDDNALPIYMSDATQSGGILDKLNSSAWWATTGADGAGFLLSMLAPGQAIKALGIGGKLAKGMQGAEAVAALVEEGNALSKASKLLKPSLWNKAKTAQNIDQGLSVLTNTLVESSAEANNTYTELRKKLIATGMNEKDASDKAGEAASNVFKANLAVLAISNLVMEKYIMSGKLFGISDKSLASKVSSSVLAGIEKPKGFSRLSNIGKYTGAATTGFIQEGFFEEGLQTSLQQYYNKLATDGKDASWDDVAGILGKSFSNFTEFESTPDSKEYWESVALGGVLGQPMAMMGVKSQIQSDRDKIFGTNATNPSKLQKFFGAKPKKESKGLINLLQANLDMPTLTEKDIYQKDAKGELVKDADGNFILDPEAIAKYGNQVENFVHMNAQMDVMKEIFEQQGMAEQSKEIDNFRLNHWLSTYAEIDGGLDVLAQHADSYINKMAEKRKADFGIEMSSKEKSDLKEKITKRGQILSDINKANLETFDSMKTDDPVFNQKLFTLKNNLGYQLASVKERITELTQRNTELENSYQWVAKNDKLAPTENEDPSQMAERYLDPAQAAEYKRNQKAIELLSKKEEIQRKELQKLYTKKGITEEHEAYKQSNTETEQQDSKSTKQNKFSKLLDDIKQQGYADDEKVSIKKDGVDYTLSFFNKGGKPMVGVTKGKVTTPYDQEGFEKFINESKDLEVLTKQKAKQVEKKEKQKEVKTDLFALLKQQYRDSIAIQEQALKDQKAAIAAVEALETKAKELTALLKTAKDKKEIQAQLDELRNTVLKDAEKTLNQAKQLVFRINDRVNNLERYIVAITDNNNMEESLKMDKGIATVEQAREYLMKEVVITNAGNQKFTDLEGQEEISKQKLEDLIKLYDETIQEAIDLAALIKTTEDQLKKDELTIIRANISLKRAFLDFLILDQQLTNPNQKALVNNEPEEDQIEAETEEDVDIDSQYEAWLKSDRISDPFTTTGLDVFYEFDKNGNLVNKRLSTGQNEINPSQNNWFDFLDKQEDITKYKLRFVNLQNADEEVKKKIEEEQGLSTLSPEERENALYVIIVDNDNKPVKHNNELLLTSISLPQRLLTDGSRPSRMNDKAIENYAPRFVKATKTLKGEALVHKDYETWYNKTRDLLNKGAILYTNINEVTPGHYNIDDTNHNALSSLGIKVEPNGKLTRRGVEVKLVVVPQSGEIKLNGKEYKLNPGTVIIKTSDSFFFIHQPRLDDNQVMTAVYLLSQLDSNTAEINGTQIIPYKQDRSALITRLFNYGFDNYKNSSRIYRNKDGDIVFEVNNHPELSGTITTEELQDFIKGKRELSSIKESEPLYKLVMFLRSKNLIANKDLFGKSFEMPEYSHKTGLKFVKHKTYDSFIVSKSTSKINPNRPRVQRNLVFNPNHTQDVIAKVEETKKKTSRKPKESKEELPLLAEQGKTQLLMIVLKPLDINLPDYAKEEMTRQVAQAEKLGVLDKIIKLAFDGNTAAQTVTKLKMSNKATVDGSLRDTVRAVRTLYGIPSLDNKTEFNEWKKTTQAKILDFIDKDTKEETQTVDKRAEIEKRREEELNTEAQNIVVKQEIFSGLDVNEEPITYRVSTNADGSRVIALELNTNGRISYTSLEKVSKDNHIGNREYLNMSYGLSKSKLISTNNSPQSAYLNKINAKYDAELKALEQEKFIEETKQPDSPSIDELNELFNLDVEAPLSNEEPKTDLESPVEKRIQELISKIIPSTSIKDVWVIDVYNDFVKEKIFKSKQEAIDWIKDYLNPPFSTLDPRLVLDELINNSVIQKNCS